MTDHLKEESFRVLKSSTGEDAIGWGVNEVEARKIAGNFSVTLKEAFEVRDAGGEIVHSVHCRSVDGPMPAQRDAFYAILTRYVPQEPIDQAWQEIKQAGGSVSV